MRAFPYCPAIRGVAGVDHVYRARDRDRFGSVRFSGLPVNHELFGHADLFFPGALFPLTNLPTVLNVIATIDPLSYGVDGLRSALMGVAHFGLPLDLAVLSVIAVALLGLGSVLFSRIQL
jgi:ABC-type polysaccharide/polyol phosphate export permease